MVRPIAICAIIASLLVVQAAFAFGTSLHSATTASFRHHPCILCASDAGPQRASPIVVVGFGIVLSDGASGGEVAATTPPQSQALVTKR